MPESAIRVLSPITLEDQHLLWLMLYQAIYVPPGETPPAPEIVKLPELARYVSDWGKPNDLGLKAMESSTHQPIGAVWLRLLRGANRGYGYIDDETPELSIAVLAEHRGKG